MLALFVNLLLLWFLNIFAYALKLLAAGPLTGIQHLFKIFYAIALKSENLLPLYNIDRHPPLPELIGNEQ